MTIGCRHADSETFRGRTASNPASPTPLLPLPVLPRGPMTVVRRVLLACALFFAVPSLQAQEGPPPRAAAPDSTEQLRLFLDCASSGCDFDYLRTELNWVNYVRDRTAAEVHVISTSLGTGSGGQEVTFKFIGLKQFTG